MMNSMNREQTDDLKAFEHRLIECVASIRQRTRIWRYLLVGVFIWFVVSVVLWWRDDAEYDSYWDVMMAYKSLSASLMAFFLLYIFGIFDRNNAPQITCNAGDSTPLSTAFMSVSSPVTDYEQCTSLTQFSSITSRCRSVLQEYNMSCDEAPPPSLVLKGKPLSLLTYLRNYKMGSGWKQGKLILKKKPDYVWYSKTS